MTQFRDLTIGASFDFINDARPTFNSFYDRCRKIAARKYASIKTGEIYTVGTINATVYHVEQEAR